MKFFKVFTLIVLGCIILFFAVGIFLPKSATLERRYEIESPAYAVRNEIVQLYENHLWPIWSMEDSSVVFIPLKTGTGYSWEDNNIGKGMCRYSFDADLNIHDNISFNDREVATTLWAFEGADPVILNFSITINAGRNISTRWTNLFLDRLIGAEIDGMIDDIKTILEISG